MTYESSACTGIKLVALDNSQIVARTIEWGASELISSYVIVPIGHNQNAILPDGTNGLGFPAKYGYVGLSVEQPEFIAEGINETGLSVGLFYFPGYGGYITFDPKHAKNTISDLQLVSWILSNFKTIDEVKNAINDIRIVTLDPRADTLHWRIAEPNGRQVVLEVINGVPRFYENELGVLTNSPNFEWQITNLNNYVNLRPGNASPQSLNKTPLSSFGAGTGFLGLPGDMSPPSRFVRAVFFSAFSQPKNAANAVTHAFHILNNFDIPLEIEFKNAKPPIDIPSATQWTSVTDMTSMAIYYRTMYDTSIRKIDLKKIDFEKIEYRVIPLDLHKQQPIVEIKIMV